MSETEQAIASLRSSIDALRAMTLGLQAQAAGKADASAVEALSTRITSCEGLITALGLSVAAQRPAVSTLTSRVATECKARAHADMALTTRAIPIQGLSNTLDLHVRPDEAVEPLRMGKVVFHGDTARAIRDAQVVLKAANVGQLEVVKRANEAGKASAVIDGQVFISEAETKATTHTIKPVLGGNGQYHFSGFGVGIGQATGGTAKAPVDAGQLLSELTKQITESELGTDLHSRVTELEKAGASQGAENRALYDRLASLERDLAEIKRPRFGRSWPGIAPAYAMTADTQLASATHQPKSE